MPFLKRVFCYLPGMDQLTFLTVITLYRQLGDLREARIFNG
ncbi:hypothetical protein [Halomonas sp. G11]|nr:hypothetical protein [Halomonas sp. G11]